MLIRTHPTDHDPLLGLELRSGRCGSSLTHIYSLPRALSEPTGPLPRAGHSPWGGGREHRRTAQPLSAHFPCCVGLRQPGVRAEGQSRFLPPPEVHTSPPPPPSSRHSPCSAPAACSTAPTAPQQSPKCSISAALAWRRPCTPRFQIGPQDPHLLLPAIVLGRLLPDCGLPERLPSPPRPEWLGLGPSVTGLNPDHLCCPNQ